jgi:hypothetical protein
MLQSDLYQWMITTPEVSVLFPGGIHHESLPQDVSDWPAMHYTQVSHQEIAEDMESPNDQKIDQLLFQFDVIGRTSAEAINAAHVFLGIFRNYRGTMLATRVQWISLSNVSQLEDRRGDKLRRRVSMDFSITIDVTE